MAWCQISPGKDSVNVYGQFIGPLVMAIGEFHLNTQRHAISDYYLFMSMPSPHVLFGCCCTLSSGLPAVRSAPPLFCLESPFHIGRLPDKDQ
jgi:hypothetical protein